MVHSHLQFIKRQPLHELFISRNHKNGTEPDFPVHVGICSYVAKSKIISVKMVPPMGIEPALCDFFVCTLMPSQLMEDF